MGKGIFYAVSVGAGDPLDMTLRAKQVLEQADAPGSAFRPICSTKWTNSCF